jgi:hypothetical protein
MQAHNFVAIMFILAIAVIIYLFLGADETPQQRINTVFYDIEQRDILLGKTPMQNPPQTFNR